MLARAGRVTARSLGALARVSAPFSMVAARALRLHRATPLLAAERSVLPSAERHRIRHNGPHLARHAERGQHAQARAAHLALHTLLWEFGHRLICARHRPLHWRSLWLQSRASTVPVPPTTRAAADHLGAGPAPWRLEIVTAWCVPSLDSAVYCTHREHIRRPAHSSGQAVISHRRGWILVIVGCRLALPAVWRWSSDLLSS